MHHAAIRTADIHRAITFYQQLGFELEVRYTTGITLACWLVGLGSRLELIEIPHPKPAPDAFGDERYVGYYHLSFDLSATTDSLTAWLEALRARLDSAAACDPDRLAPLQVLLAPTTQAIGNGRYEVAFIADSDGLPLEFLRRQDAPNGEA